MTPYYADSWLTVYAGDCRAVMAEMPAQSVHCVVTSPPYWGLRDYGTATWVGGDEACDHVNRPGEATGNKGAVTTTPMLAVCRKCGATRVDGQIGLEPTPEAYVETMLAVFREVRRVLRDDGTVWLNLGDSYSGSWSGHSMRPDGGEQRAGGPGFQPLDGRYPARPPNVPGLKPKDLVGIPWRTAFALQADGWYLRSDVVWSKPNPMPESVMDRPTKSHEYVFLLSKRERYYFDADAVRGPAGDERVALGRRPISERQAFMQQAGMHGKSDSLRDYSRTERNIRTVWTIATQPYPGAHFATFPEALVEPCVKAGSPVDGMVLDPFAGSGTTGRVAQRLGRRAVLIDLNPAYLVQAMRRNRDIPLGLGFGPTEDAA